MRNFAAGRFETFSAGLNPSTVNPYAIKVMAEVGIDISSQHSKHIKEFLAMSFDYVVTVCDHAKEHCPYFSGQVKHRLHWSFPDPAAFEGGEQEKTQFFREVRDMIKTRILEFLAGQQEFRSC